MLSCLGSAGKAHSNSSSDLNTRLDEPEQPLLQGTVALVGCVWAPLRKASLCLLHRGGLCILYGA